MWQTLQPAPWWGGGSSVQPASRLAPNFNGVSQYGDVGGITYTGDYSRSATVVMPTLSGNFVRLWGKSGDFTSRFLISDDGSANIKLSDTDNTGVNIPPGVFAAGQTFNVTVSRTGSNAKVTVNGVDFDFTSVNTGGSTFNYIQRMSTSYGVGVVFDYYDSIGNFFPMDDGWPNNPVMRNTGTGADGTFVNMTEAAWVEVPA